MKNLQSRKALVKISIDGEGIGNDLIIRPNSTLNLERFLGNLNQGNKFLFIEKSKKISDFRGDRIDDGILRVEIFFEKEKVEIPVFIHKHYYEYYPIYYPNVTWTYNNDTITTCNSRSIGSLTCQSLNNVNNNISLDSFNDYGITAKGSISNQQFSYGDIDTLENNSTVFVFQLKGIKSSGVEIKEPITKKSKLICELCRTNNNIENKFCSECGNFLNN